MGATPCPRLFGIVHTMIRGLLVAALLVASVWMSPAGAQSPPAPTEAPLSFKILVDQIEALFPVIRTDVVEITGDRIILASGRADRMQPGVELATFREGRELIHPTTKKSLGRVEEPLGRIVVAEVFENYSVARPVDGKLPQAGDRARVSAGKRRLALVPLVGPGVASRVVDAASQELVQELERTGRFQIVIGDQVAVYLAQERISIADFLAGKGVRQAQERLKMPHLLALGFTMTEGKPFIDVRLFAAAVDAPLVQTSLYVPAGTVKPKPTEQFSAAGGAGDAKIVRRSLLARLLSGDFDPNTYSSASATIPIRQIATFPFTVVSMDVTLSPGDRIPRLVVSDGQKVYLYRLEGQTLTAEWTFDKLMIGNILSVQFADLNGDGVLDVVVNRQDYKAGMLSYILTTREGRPAMLAADIPLILFAADEKGDGVRRELWASRYVPDAFYSKGGATRYVLKEDKKDIVAAGRVEVNDQFRGLGATFSNTGGKDSRVMAFVDERNRLVITSNGQDTWRSLTPVGGGLTRAHLQVKSVRNMNDVDKFVKIEPNPVAIDLDGDGIEEIVVPVNSDEAGRMAVVFRGPAGFRMQVVDSGFEGMITGLGAIPGVNGTPPSLVSAVVKRTGLLKMQGDTQLIMTLAE